ncbi:hypothetical protein J7643_03790 [bacterium]|nr:hypothetical protein [bacterium]
MRRQYDAAKGLTWIDPTITHSDVRADTQKRFEPLRDEQLKALMLQVAKISEASGVALDPVFASALEERIRLMADHALRKASAEPDGDAPDVHITHVG